MAFAWVNRLLRVARSKTTTLFDAVVFNGTTTTYTSASIDCRNYHSFLLELSILSTETPTDILFSVEFSDDDVTFYKYMNGFWGDLRYEDTATASRLNESLSEVCYGKFMRVSAIATGTSTENKFAVIIKADLIA